MAVELESIVPWGRSFDEYVRMFALTEADLSGHVLDCAAGPSSFHAELRARGGRVVSVDPIYALSPADIRGRVEAVRDDMMAQVRLRPDQFIWDFIHSPNHLERVRMGAMARFLDDFAGDPGRERYRPQSLPALDFADGAFDLALCSHCLFLYSDRLDARFHTESVRELLRVARQVRVFPITDLAGGESPHLAAVRAQFPTERVRVDYEFLRGANEMLVVTRSARPAR